MADDVLHHIREHARRDPDHPAVLADDAAAARAVVTTYAELVAHFDAFAAELRARGVRPGQRCGLLARQGTGFIESALGIMAADACFVPVPDDTQAAALERAVSESQLHHLVDLSDDSSDGFGFRSFAGVADVDGADEREFRALRPAYLRFTSGTTSVRKGVIIGHDAILERLEAANRALRIEAADRILWLLPMAHHFVVSILLYLRFGATILLPAGSLARAVLAMAQRERASVFYASPYHYNLLAKDASGVGLESVRLAVSTADGLRVDVAERFRERFGLPLVQALGIIEVGLPVMNTRSAASKPDALGQPVEGYDVWLRDEEGKPLHGPGSPERTGEVCIRGSGFFGAYLRPWTPSREVTEPDGFRTGDQAWFDADGDLRLAGRRANRINMAGMKFFSEEVEAVLDSHPAVESSRVFARDHAHLGEIPVAEIVPVDPAAPPARKALASYCRERLSTYKVPREFRVVETLAMTTTGKLRRWDGDT